MSKINLPLIIGNWKMNGLIAESMIRLKEICNHLNSNINNCKIIICPPITLLRDMVEKTPGTDVTLGAQNCHFSDAGSFTGEISVNMLSELNCKFIILGHSERREHFKESSELVAKKALNVLKHNLTPIICVGEDIETRKSNNHIEYIKNQLISSLPENFNGENAVIAYEPVWAIGSNRIPELEEIEEVHSELKKFITEKFENTPKIVYGGSVSSENSNSILKLNNIDGLLIGRSSLDAKEFCSIVDGANQIVVNKSNIFGKNIC